MAGAPWRNSLYSANVVRAGTVYNVSRLPASGPPVFLLLLVLLLACTSSAGPRRAVQIDSHPDAAASRLWFRGADAREVEAFVTTPQSPPGRTALSIGPDGAPVEVCVVDGELSYTSNAVAP